MKRWKYKFIRGDSRGGEIGEREFEEYLNNLGREGWRVMEQEIPEAAAKQQT